MLFHDGFPQEIFTAAHVEKSNPAGRSSRRNSLSCNMPAKTSQQDSVALRPAGRSSRRSCMAEEVIEDGWRVNSKSGNIVTNQYPAPSHEGGLKRPDERGHSLVPTTDSPLEGRTNQAPAPSHEGGLKCPDGRGHSLVPPTKSPLDPPQPEANMETPQSRASLA